MNETPTQKPEPPRASAPDGLIIATFNRVVQLIPPKARLAVLTGLLVLVGLAVYTSLFGGSATLNLICRHDLRSADISVSIDGRTTYTDHISASPKKLFAILGKRGETFSKSLTVPSGEHVVQVHLSSATDGFDQTKQRELNLLPGNETTLRIDAQRNGMSMVYPGPVTAPTKNLGSAFPDSLRSILVTLLGSAVSAAIGFVVQEFLRSRKAA
jgi:hypothetical protein